MPHFDLPSGSIILWSGAIVDIPADFFLCDGNNGTPDLQNRFIVGSGATFNPGDNGGAIGHIHTGTTDGHEHVFPAGASIAAGTAVQIVSTNETDTFTTGNANHRPPYYSLAYIMKA